MSGFLERDPVRKPASGIALGILASKYYWRDGVVMPEIIEKLPIGF